LSEQNVHQRPADIIASEVSLHSLICKSAKPANIADNSLLVCFSNIRSSLQVRKPGGKGNKKLESQHRQNKTEDAEMAFDEYSTFNLVCKLLSEVLADGNDEELLITSKSEDFICDSAAGFEITEPFKDSITGADLNETGLATEVSVSGIIEGTNADRYSFTLYFTMRREIPVIPRKKKHIDNLNRKFPGLSRGGDKGKLYNSIFTLILRCADDGDQSPFGEGRGYLVFMEEL